MAKASNSAKTVPVLRKELESRGLETEGLKQALVKRLDAAMKEDSAPAAEPKAASPPPPPAAPLAPLAPSKPSAEAAPPAAGCVRRSQRYNFRSTNTTDTTLGRIEGSLVLPVDENLKTGAMQLVVNMSLPAGGYVTYANPSKAGAPVRFVLTGHSLLGGGAQTVAASPSQGGGAGAAPLPAPTAEAAIQFGAREMVLEGADALVAKLGGNAKFVVKDLDESHNECWDEVSTYFVIGATEAPDAALLGGNAVAEWTPPKEAIQEMLKCLKHAPSNLYDMTDCVRHIASFVKTEVDWAGLEKRVEASRASLFDTTPLQEKDWPTAKEMVEQYRLFIELKATRKDYGSQQLSPSMLPDPSSGVRLIDEVWHLHISMGPSYDADCKIMTQGRVLHHMPVPVEIALPRYERALMLVPQAKKKARYWPELPVEEDDDYYGDGYGGCC